VLDIRGCFVYTGKSKANFTFLCKKMDKQVTNQIKKYRMQFGLTQKDLAELAGVSRQSIISIEQGRYVPSLPLALKFAQIFNCATDVLFQLAEDA
jgi:putative transcriptional regulator